jgi:cytochrome c-type biogenesis protein CcmH/NrfG
MRHVGVLLLIPGLLIGCTSLDGDPYALQREAEAAWQGSDDTRTETLLRALLRAAPNDAESWFRLGNLMARQERYEDAADAYQRCLMLKSSDARAWHNLGRVRLRQASVALLQAKALAGDDAELARRSGQLLETLAMPPKPKAGAQP